MANKLNIGDQDRSDDSFLSLSYIGPIILSTSIGFVMGGPAGAIMYLPLSLLDSYLNYKIGNHNYLSRTIVWNSILKKANLPYLSSPWVSLLALSPLISYLTEDFLDYKTLSSDIDSLLSVNKLFDKEEVLSKKELMKIYDKLYDDPKDAFNTILKDSEILVANPFLMNLTGILSLVIITNILDTMFLLKMTNYLDGSLINNIIRNNPNTDFKTLTKKGIYVAGIFYGKKFLDSIIKASYDLLAQNQRQIIFEKTMEIVLDEGNWKKFPTSEKAKASMISLFHDLNHISDIVVSKLENQSIVKGLLAFSYLPELIVMYLPKILLLQWLIPCLSLYTQSKYKIISEAYSKELEMRYHIYDNILEIAMRDAKEFNQYKYDQYLSIKNSKESEIIYIDVIDKAAEELVDTMYNIFDIFYFGKKFLDGATSIDKIILEKRYSEDLLKFLLSNTNYIGMNSELLVVQKRVNEFFSIINTSKDPISFIQIGNNNEGKIIFKDYLIRLDGQLLLKIDDLEFQAGKHYAITGKSGCGKTSTLIDLKHGLSSPLSSDGSISYPDIINQNKAKLMFIDQNSYMPLDSTLLELACFPNLLNKEQLTEMKSKVISLFKELEIDEFINDPNNNEGLLSRLDSKDFKLSGGQAKKILVIQAILNQPTILIADEITNGLDKISLIKVQNALSKYLPNTMIVFVDHHAEDNNYDNFYDYEVNFSGGGTSIRNIASKSGNIEGLIYEATDYENNDYCVISQFWSNHIDQC